jgi:hypothetical protein
VKLTTHRQVVPRSIKRGSIHPLPIRLDGVGLNLLSTGTTLSSYLGEEERMGKPEGRRPLGRPRRRWLNNIRMDLVEVGWGDVDWIWLRIGTGGGLL